MDHGNPNHSIVLLSPVSQRPHFLALLSRHWCLSRRLGSTPGTSTTWVPPAYVRRRSHGQRQPDMTLVTLPSFHGLISSTLCSLAVPLPWPAGSSTWSTSMSRSADTLRPLVSMPKSSTAAVPISKSMSCLNSSDSSPPNPT